MKTLIAALAVLVSIPTLADDPVVERGKFVTGRRVDGVSGLFLFGAVGAAASAASGKPPPRNLVVCTYKGPSGQTWEETYTPPCHSFSTHTVQPATSPAADDHKTPAAPPTAEVHTSPATSPAADVPPTR